MSQNPATSPRSQQDKHRVRPKLNWKIPLLVIGLLLFFGLGIGTGYLLWGYPLSQNRAELENVKVQLETLKGSVPAGEEEASVPTGEEEASGSGEIKQVTRYDIQEDDDPSYGPADAPITIIEFSDFQCPYCQRWHEEVWSKLIQTFPDQIRLVYRDFPLYSIHAEAGPAAAAAECAGEQDAYWEYHDLLFSGGLKLSRETYLQYANDLGLKSDAFEACLNDNRYEAEVTADYEYALSLGIQSTPTFFINGIALVGAQPFEVFQEVIELELAGQLSR